MRLLFGVNLTLNLLNKYWLVLLVGWVLSLRVSLILNFFNKYWLGLLWLSRDLSSAFLVNSAVRR